MKLHEIATLGKHHPKIKKWLDKMYIKDYTIQPNGTVDVNGSVNLLRFDEASLPIQFGKVVGTFDCRDSKLTTLKGCPYYIGGDFYCYGCPISSLEYAPQSVGGRFSCFETNIRSLTGISKQIKHIGGTFVCSAKTTHLLGLLLIDGLRVINVDTGKIDDILNKYIGTGDILSAQDELIDASFIDQARL
jgi:hypothetical protein